MVGHNRRRILRQAQKAKSFLKLLSSRECGSLKKITADNVLDSLCRLPHVWKRRSADPGYRNKIFASQWLTANHVIYGTKCNCLVLHDFTTDKGIEIPLITPNKTSRPNLSASVCGIHSIQLNPSRNLLATGGADVNDIGIYELNELSPYGLFYGFHRDCVFDLRWLDDSCLASCSRDSSLALWQIPADLDCATSCNDFTSSIHCISESSKIPFVARQPIAYIYSSIPDDRFRALEYLAHLNMLTVVSLSRRFYLYDAVRIGQDPKCRPIFTLALRDAYQEAVALRRWPADPNCVALATHHCVLLFDIRCSDPVKTSGRCVHPPVTSSGIRSLNFAGNILSYGTSTGQIHFYDLRGNERLPLYLDVGPGWIKPEVCEEEISSLSFDDVTNFTLYTPTTPTPSTNHSAVNVADNSTALPPSSSYLPASNQSQAQGLNRGNPLSFIGQQQQNSGNPSGDSTSNVRGAYTSQVSNLRVRLDRIQNLLADIRDRRNSLRSASVSSVVTARDLLSTSTEQPATTYNVRGSRRNLRRRRPLERQSNIDESDDDNDANTGEASIAASVVEVNGEVEDDEEEVFLVTRLRQRNSRNNLRSNVNMRRTSGSLFWRFPSLSNFSRYLSPDVGFPLADLYPALASYNTLSSQRSTLAVYTHEYDPSGTRLFTAGGPITSNSYGNVAALWE